MKKEFIPYEQALKLKEIGFDEPCIALYDEKYLTHDEAFNVNNDDTWITNLKLSSSTNKITAPLYQQVFKWFREKHQLFCEIETDCTTYPKFGFKISRFTGNPNDLTEREWGWDALLMGAEWCLYRTYEEAELECLKKLLEVVQGKEMNWSEL